MPETVGDAMTTYHPTVTTSGRSQCPDPTGPDPGGKYALEEQNLAGRDSLRMLEMVVLRAKEDPASVCGCG